MDAKLTESAKKVQDALIEKGFCLVVKELPHTTRTAVEAAEAIGCEVAQFAKSLVFIDEISNAPILLIVSGARQVDVKKLEEVKGLKLLKADGKTVKERTGFAIGGVPPIGHLEKVTTFLDLTLKTSETIWAAAGTPFAVFQLTSAELKTLTEGEYIEMTV